MIPVRLQPDARRIGETRLFDGLAAALPGDYTVMHSVRWLERPARRRLPREFEIDFLVLHPERGALTIEVKGGVVHFDAHSGAWTSTSVGGAVHPIHDPESQAREACHGLIDLLSQAHHMPEGFGPFGYGVAFPDAALVGSPPALPREIVIEAPAVGDPPALRAAIQRMYAHWGAITGGRSTAQGVARIVELLARDLTTRQPLVVRVNEADREIIRLGEQQFAILDYMRGHRRVAVAGCAGSGKTLLAAAKARELAGQGFRVLLTCFNRALADHLSEALAGTDGVEVRSFHQLCRRFADEAEVALDWPVEPDQAFFDSTLPEALVRAVDRLGPPYDAIIADEGQDFAASWWDPLLLLLTDPDAGVLFVFYDDNQALYHRPRGLPSGVVEFPLSQNWRNTRQIHQAVLPYYRGPEIRSMGPSGPEVEMVNVEPGIAASRAMLGRVLHQLHVDEGVPCADIVVLTPRSPASSGLLGPVGSFRVVEERAGARDVRVASIHGFKGLDSKVVVLAGVSARDAEFRELMYVGCSRARSHLVVLEVS